jgi:hypothetical protein
MLILNSERVKKLSAKDPMMKQKHYSDKLFISIT